MPLAMPKVLILASIFAITGSTHAACTTSGKDAATTLECDQQTMSKAKEPANSRASTQSGTQSGTQSAASLFVSPNSPAENISVDTSSHAQTGSLRTLTAEEKAAPEAPQQRK
jgi:hypothetical protein